MGWLPTFIFSVKLLGEIWGNQGHCSLWGKRFNWPFLMIWLVLNPGFLKFYFVCVASVPPLGQADHAAGVRTREKWTIQGPGTDNTRIVFLFTSGKAQLLSTGQFYSWFLIHNWKTCILYIIIIWVILGEKNVVRDLWLFHNYLLLFSPSMNEEFRYRLEQPYKWTLCKITKDNYITHCTVYMVYSV